jgi:GTP 3',8-cyclase
MGDFNLDGHKLHYHPGRLKEWLDGKTVYPVYIENSPSGACNHRCRFCALDFMGYQRRFLDWDIFRDRLTEMGERGVKSMMHAGEGEPLLHPNLEEMMQHGKACGIDQALSTNGVLLDPSRAEKILPHAEWIRISLDAGTPDTYAMLHRTQARDFDQVLENLAAAARMRTAAGWRCTLGVQMLLPENRGEIRTLAVRARDAGADYLAIKPYSQHPKSGNTAYRDIRYAEDLALQEAAEQMSAPGFQVIFRANAMRKWDAPARDYCRCLALHFWTHIDAGGFVWACSMYMNDADFLLGNIHEEPFRAIWEGERRAKVMKRVAEELDARQCRVNCRMDEVNRYLHDLRNPPDHVNFI